MASNPFEDSRVSEGTMRHGAQHVTNLPNLDHPAFREETIVEADLKPVRRVVGVSQLMHAGVRNPAGDSLGKIEDIMVDLAAGQIAYAVLSFGGVFGIGSKFFVMPWSALRFDHLENEFILDVERDVLEKGPGFDKDNWPDLADFTYGAHIYQHYGKTPYWEGRMTDFGGD